MSLCRWTDDGNGRLYCPACDPDRRRTVSRPSKRICGTPKAATEEKGRLSANYPTPPSLVQQAWNLTKAIAAFIVDPTFVSKEAYHSRLHVCDPCEFRSNWRCLKCGCMLAAKAKLGSEDCPEEKWPTAG